MVKKDNLSKLEIHGEDIVQKYIYTIFSLHVIVVLEGRVGKTKTKGAMNHRFGLEFQPIKETTRR